jgi:hypothetical protein
VIHPQDTRPGGAAHPAEVVRDAAARLSRLADFERYRTGERPDLGEIDLLLGQGLASLLARHRPAMVKALALRAAKAHATYGRLLTGQSVDAMELALELNAIKAALAILRLGDDRSATLASRSAPPAESAAPLQ